MYRSTSLDVAARTLVSCRAELRNCIWDLRNRTLEAKDMNEAIRAPGRGTRIAVSIRLPDLEEGKISE